MKGVALPVLDGDEEMGLGSAGLGGEEEEEEESDVLAWRERVAGCWDRLGRWQAERGLARG